MSRIINIRGTNGAGKSWTVRQVMAACGWVHAPVTWRNTVKVEGYLCENPAVFVLGAYGARDTAGADTFKDLDDIEEIVHRCADAGHAVLFEGVRVSGGYARWVEAARSWGHEWHFIILDTPLEQAYAQVLARRAAAGNTRPADKLRETVADNYRRSRRQRYVFHEAGLNFYTLPAADAVAKTLELLA